jgi:intron-binding protein aquarius
VALSRARLGLYILGRRDVFESCLELKPAFDILGKRPDKLMLTTGEMFPTNRTLEQPVEGTAMEGLEHLGQYVYEMTQAKIKALGKDPEVLDEILNMEGSNEGEDKAMLPTKADEERSSRDDLV